MWKLVIEDDEARRTSVPLTREEYSIGRKEGNSIRLTERNVSRDHVRLKKHQNGAGPTYMLEDLKSYNGVYVNGIRVATSQELVDGDLVQIGDYRILFQEDAPEQTATQELATVPGAAQAVPQGARPPGGSAPEFDVKTTQPGAVASSFRGSLLMERPIRLVMLVGPTPGVEYPLDKERMTIGRAEDASISINHNSVSRLHCEIHAIGEGRYEIVDKGSSNGIRVNAAELRRGIVEAGDLIELGDVRLKFVAAGQVFVPGPNESQQLTAISDRIAPDPNVRRTKTGIMPFVILGAVVAGIVLIGGFLFLRKHGQQAEDPSQQAQAPIDAEHGILQDALRMCTKEDCERAHVKATTELRENSPLRESADFQHIEAMWAEWMFAKADAEPDFAKKKDIFQRVSQTITVDKEHRNTATQKLDALDKGASNDIVTDPAGQTSQSAQNPSNSVPDPTAPPPPGTVSTVSVSTRPTQTAPTATRVTVPPVQHTATAVAQPPPTVATAKPPVQSDVDRARQALLENDPVRAKLILYPKLAKGGTADELNVLKQACKATNDPQCVAECKKRLGQQ